MGLKKAPLYCLVHGKPERSVFGIKYDKTTTVDEFKDSIKNKLRPSLDNVSVEDLNLYKVNIDLTTINPQRTALGNPNSNIVNDLGGQLLIYKDIIEEKLPTTFLKNNIHIIVEVIAPGAPGAPAPAPALALTFPATAEASSETTEGESSYKRSVDTFTETTQQFANIIDRQTKKPKVSLSSMNQTHLDELLKHLNFRRATSVITVNSTNKDFDVQFVWDERAENQHAEDQKDSQDRVIKRGYMNYLGDNISISSTLVWYDPKSKKDLLNVNDVSLPYSISGTTDVLVMDESFYSVLDYRSGIRAGFELKKTVQDLDVNQAIAELIATNILSNYAVFLVLTDLNNSWIFYWLSNDRTIMMFRAVNSSNALYIIERALAENPTSITTTTTTDPNFPIITRVNCFRHLEHLQEASENEMESLEQFLNRPKVQFEFEDDVANMKDMFDEMTEEEIKGWKVRRALKLLDETPGFQLDKNYMSMYS